MDSLPCVSTKEAKNGRGEVGEGGRDGICLPRMAVWGKGLKLDGKGKISSPYLPLCSSKGSKLWSGEGCECSGLRLTRWPCVNRSERCPRPDRSRGLISRVRRGGAGRRIERSGWEGKGRTAQPRPLHIKSLPNCVPGPQPRHLPLSHTHDCKDIPQSPPGLLPSAGKATKAGGEVEQRPSLKRQKACCCEGDGASPPAPLLLAFEKLPQERQEGT